MRFTVFKNSYFLLLIKKLIGATVGAVVVVSLIAGCGQQKSTQPALYFEVNGQAMVWHAEDEQPQLHHGLKPEQEVAAAERYDSRNGKHRFSLDGIRQPPRLRLTRHDLQSGQSLTLAAPSPTRTVVDAMWWGPSDDGLLFMADFHADDRYELYWWPNTLGTDSVVRLTPNLPLGGDVVDWRRLSGTQLIYRLRGTQGYQLRVLNWKNGVPVSEPLIGGRVAEPKLQQLSLLGYGALPPQGLWLQTPEKIWLYSLSAKHPPKSLNYISPPRQTHNTVTFANDDSFNLLLNSGHFSLHTETVVEAIHCNGVTWWAWEAGSLSGHWHQSNQGNGARKGLPGFTITMRSMETTEYQAKQPRLADAHFNYLPENLACMRAK